jgi:VIT1/CCC1 family predicted Fe2+/Mn2+ transporter
MKKFDHNIEKKIMRIQRDEITEYAVYRRLASIVKSKEQAQLLEKIAEEERGHYEFFRELTRKEVRPSRFKEFWYVFLSRALGLNFSLKLMERGEDIAQDTYGKILEVSPKIEEVVNDEKRHEMQLLEMINEERLKYMSSVVLGLNDALVELSGALVGFTLALQQTRIVGIVGLITGIAASMSMAASEYLSTRHEETDKNPLTASLYTGCAYLGTVILLVFPYFVFDNILFCLVLLIWDAFLLIIFFNYYISVAKGANFKMRFLEMVGISLGIAAINFVIGLVIRSVFRIDI